MLIEKLHIHLRESFLPVGSESFGSWRSAWLSIPSKWHAKAAANCKLSESNARAFWKRLVPVVGSALVAGLGCYPIAALAEYTVQPGDTLSIMTIGDLDIAHRTVVDIEGNATLPLIGRISVAGLSQEDMQSRVAGALMAVPVRVTSQDGTERFVRLRREEILVEILEYTPVYIVGEVASSSEVIFIPGMTVRKLIARAGGVGALIETGGSPFRALELAADRRIAEARVTSLLEQVRRIRAELADIPSSPEVEYKRSIPSYRRQEDSPSLEATPPALKLRPQRMLDDRGDVSSDLVNAGTALRVSSEKTMGRLLGEFDVRLEILNRRQVENEALIQHDREDLDKVKGLIELRLAPASAASEPERAILMSTMQFYETADAIARLNIERSRIRGEFEKSPVEAARNLLLDLEDRMGTTEEAMAELDAIKEQLAQLQPSSDTGRIEYTFTIHRGSGTEAVSVAVDVDTELLPGDVVAVTSRVVD